MSFKSLAAVRWKIVPDHSERRDSSTRHCAALIRWIQRCECGSAIQQTEVGRRHNARYVRIRFLLLGQRANTSEQRRTVPRFRYKSSLGRAVGLLLKVEIFRPEYLRRHISSVHDVFPPLRLREPCAPHRRTLAVPSRERAALGTAVAVPDHLPTVHGSTWPLVGLWSVEQALENRPTASCVHLLRRWRQLRVPCRHLR